MSPCWFRKAGGEAAGPVVRDIIKAYYDKKNKKTQGQFTAENKSDTPQKRTRPAVNAPRAALKPEETAAVVPTSVSTEPQR